LPQAVRMLLTGYSDLAAMVGSINDGEVFRFVKKPWDNDEIRATLAEAAVLAENLALTPEAPAPSKPSAPAPSKPSASAPAKPSAPAAAKPAAAPQPAAPSACSAGSLLVIDPNEAMGKGLQRLVTGEASVMQVPNVPL